MPPHRWSTGGPGEGHGDGAGRAAAGRHPGGGRGRLQPADGARRGRHLRPPQAAAQGAGRADPGSGTAAGSSTSRATAPSSSSSSVIAAVEAAVAIQRAMLAQDPELPEDRRIRYRIGINLGDVIVDGEHDLRRRRQRRGPDRSPCASPAGSGCRAASTTRSRASSTSPSRPSGLHQVKNISEAVETFRVALDGVAPAAPPGRATARGQRWALLAAGGAVRARVPGGVWRFWPARAAAQAEAGDRGAAVRQLRRRRGDRAARGRAHRGHHHRPRPLPRPRRDRPQLDRGLQGQAGRRPAGRQGARRRLRAGGLDPAPSRPGAGHRAAHRRRPARMSGRSAGTARRRTCSPCRARSPRRSRPSSAATPA